MGVSGRKDGRPMECLWLLGVVQEDGTKMRSGHFENGEQIGEWITYDKK